MTTLIYHSCLFLFMVMRSDIYVSGARLKIEAEDMDLVNHTRIVNRSHASNKKSVLMKSGEIISFDMCLMGATDVSVESLTYSNDGEIDLIEVAVNSNISVWTLKTKLNLIGGGRGWNNFETAVSHNSSFLMKEGRHRLTIQILSADQYGVEIDYISIQAKTIQSIDALKCSVFCFDDITYVDDMPYKASQVSPATAKQNSVQTKCAEEDNVNIPVFHNSASKYVISASIPKYTTFLNNRVPDWLNCEMNHAYWMFRNVRLGQNKVDDRNGTAVMNISTLRAYLFDENSATVEVEFSLKGPSTGNTESDTGAVIQLIGIHSIDMFRVNFQYYGRSGVWSKIQTYNYNKSVCCVNFTTPDFSFFEGKGNRIRLTFLTTGHTSSNIVIDEMLMEMRVLKDGQTTIIYKDGTTIIEGVNVDMWWRINESMSVSLASSAKSINNIHFIRIYQQVPWLDASWSQVFVLYQDGNVRLLPLTPHGLDWIPFGSSIIIGQTDPSSFRPCSPIAHLDIDPTNLTLKLFYFDGGHTKLEIKTKLQETELFIVESVHTRDVLQYPFFTFRSMWINDGNADVDHVTVDGVHTQRILDNWGTLTGSMEDRWLLKADWK